jgi:hypothetical protein
MQYQILDNGNLKISVDGTDDIESLNDMYDQLGEELFLAELLEKTGWRQNGQLYEVMPEWIGALTDAPIITDRLEYDDSGSADEIGNIWWYSEYESKSWVEILLNDGSVVFTKHAGE